MKKRSLQYIYNLFAFLLFAALIPAKTFAQANEIIVRGVVKDSQGEIIPGINVSIKGTAKGTFTDSEGKYQLAVSSNSVLIISGVGYHNQEIPVEGKQEININLESNYSELDQVIVVGYGTQKKVDLTSAIATVNTEDMLKVPGGFQAVMQSGVAGVQVNAGTIRIRGVGSINNTDPLYVVDGMIGGAMPDENNIESIQVLKDAASAAIYGSRGANGVILVTTKRGIVGPPKIEYNGFALTKSLTNNIDLLNGQQLAELINEAMYNQNPSRTDYLPALSNPAAIGQGYNMVDAILRKGSYQKHNVSISGGSENTKFRINGTYSTDKPVVIRDGSESYGIQFISDLTKGRLKIGQTVLLNYNTRDWSNKNIIDAQRWSSTLPLYAPNSSTGFAGAGNGTDVASALANAHLNSNNQEGFSTNGNIWASYKIIEGLTYKFNLGVDLFRGRVQNYTPEYSVGQYQNFSPDELIISSTRNNRILYENTLNYDKNFGKHSFNALAGVTSETSRFYSLSAGARSMPSPNLLILGLSQDASSRVVNSGIGQSAMYSILGRINYNYDSRYLFTVNFRRDGSANFSKAYRYGNFPSISAGWRISEESFMKDIPYISDLKLRGSYGILGNSDIAQYQYQSTVNFNQVRYHLNDILVTGALPATPANPNVKWESQYSTDLGLDLSLFNNKVSFTLDYYNKRTEDMLVNVPISYTTGYLESFPVLNAGSIRNRGFEYALSYKNSRGKWNYSIAGNLSTVKNKVLSLGNNNELLWGTVSPGNANVTRTAVGYGIGQFWGFVTDGLYTTQEQLQADKSFAPNAGIGDIRFKDLNNDGVLNDQDKDYIGTPIPRFSYGLTTDLSYSSGFGTIDFSMIWQGSQGNDIYNNSRYWGEGMYHYYNNFATTLDRYRPEELRFTNPVSGVVTVYPKNTDTDIPRAILGDPNQNLRASDRFIEDGSYLRLKSVTIGYTFPGSVTNKLKTDRIRVYAGAKNLLTFTKYSGYDPEIGSGDGRYNLSRGIDGISPWGTTFTNTRELFLGLMLSF